MRVRTLGALAAGILLTAVIAGAQNPSPPVPAAPLGGAMPGPPRPQTPARDNPTAATGTGRIRGRVVAADNGTPLRRAQIRLTAPDVRVNRNTTTDGEGRYEFAQLPAGRYFLTVVRNGYVTLQFGQQRPFEPGRPLELADAQFMDRIDFALPRGSVIAGRITDELGEPMAGVRMTASRYRYLPSGERQLSPSNAGGMFNIVTNDLGEFRIFGLMPGTYLVSADPDQGGFISTPGGVLPPGPSSGDSDGYATTYYPGTLSADDAQTITVGVAEVVTAVFPLASVRLAKLSGTIRNASGAPAAGARVTLRARDGFGGFYRGQPPTGPDGAFTVPDVPPGDYIIEARPANMGSNMESIETGQTGVSVAGRDISDLVVTMTTGATVSGRVIYESSSTENRPDRVRAQPADPRTPFRFGPDDGAVDSDGRFRLRGLAGRVLFRMFVGTGGPGGVPWTVKSVTLNGVDVTDIPVDLSTSGDITGLEIVTSDKTTTLSGTVINGFRAPVKDYVVAVFPDRLREGVMPQRFTRTIRPDQEGRYQLRGLPPGNYLAVAVPALESGDEWDPAFRKRVEPLGKPFSLTEGQTLTLDLQLLQ